MPVLVILVILLIISLWIVLAKIFPMLGEQAKKIIKYIKGEN